MDMKTAVLVMNLGTPDDTRTISVRRYLREFLGDGRVWWRKNTIGSQFE
tara:strand:- start:449 stop:595 length:147 start_codon:yes stop_codon:yes gene_type:complete